MKHNLEFLEVSTLLKNIPKSKSQLNNLFESDCEVLKIPGGYLCSTIDSIGEEIDISLYKNPELWGWMSVMTSVSDLAASGSRPLGLLLSNQWKYGTRLKIKKLFFKGVQAALKSAQIPLLGGDSGSGESHCHTTSALGWSEARPLTRLGVQAGDVLCLVGRDRFGLGPALAFKLLFKKSDSFFKERWFRPNPDAWLSQKLRPWVRSSIDISDGLAVSLQLLRDLNHVGFKVDWSSNFVSPKAIKFCEKLALHPALLLMGDHGDYQTLLVVPRRNLTSVLRQSKSIVPIGYATQYKKKIQLIYEGKTAPLPTELVVNCPRKVSEIYKNILLLNRILKERF